MGSLRSLLKSRNLSHRYEICKSVAGNWFCLDWSTVPNDECDEAKSMADSWRQHTSRLYSKAVSDIPDTYDSAFTLKWGRRRWICSYSNDKLVKVLDLKKEVTLGY